ncbi:hypothetical protein L208DRAFT_1426627 [Tricholoma matsutake]|nr:hypothetical protein L208DRAFT_1426627 [Tricholoma matsutake 945]
MTALKSQYYYIKTLENSLNIAEQWTAASAEYQTYHQANVQTNYERAHDELERLVVMQLFELMKMSTSGTGYKLCKQIRKALQCHFEAIKNALNRFISKFDALQHAREDIHDQPWTNTARHEATTKYFKTTWLDVEIRWLWASIRDEGIHYKKVISQLSS